MADKPIRKIRELVGKARKTASAKTLKKAKFISMKTRTRMPKDLRIQLCRSCNSFLANYRVKDGQLQATCPNCGRVHRF